MQKGWSPKAVPYDVMLFTHNGILFGRVMGLSKGPAIHQNPMQCSAMHFQNIGNIPPDFEIS